MSSGKCSCGQIAAFGTCARMCERVSDAILGCLKFGFRNALHVILPSCHQFCDVDVCILFQCCLFVFDCCCTFLVDIFEHVTCLDVKSDLLLVKLPW